PKFGGRKRVLSHFHVTEDILENHHRVVDQPRERKRKPAENHGVDRTSPEVQSQKGGKTRDRYGQKNRDRCADIPKEEKDHQGRETQAYRALVDDVLDRYLHEHGL